MNIFLALLNFSLCALNVGLYAASGSPLNLGVGVLCGLVGAFMLFVEARVR